VKEKAAITKR